MTSRQRLLAALRGERLDRTPVSPFGLGHLDPAGPVAAELIARTDPFLTVGLGGNVFAGSAVPAESRQCGDETVTLIETPHGHLQQRTRRTAVTGATVEFPCKNAADVEAYLSIPFVPAEPQTGAFLARRQELGDDALLLAGIGDAICFPATILSPEDLCLLWMDDRELLCDCVGVAHGRLLAYVEAACRAGVDAFRIVGGEYATEQLGPAGFDTLVRPFDAQLVDTIHRHGALAYYHNHGYVDGYLETLADLGIDFLDPLEVPPYGNVDLADAHRRIGDRVCLVGGLDDMEVLETRDEATVRQLGRQHLESVGRVPGFCLGGTASGTYTERAARNFLALVDEAERFGR
jgi:uroporphyrinogen-III decarboxylase